VKCAPSLLLHIPNASSTNYHLFRKEDIPILIHHSIFKCLKLKRKASTNTRQKNKNKMEPKSFQYFCFLLVIFSLIIAQLSDRVSSKTNECNGSIAECSEEYEFLMPSDISKRFLEEKRKYISPGALKPNRPVCNGGASGQSYSSSCLPPPSNPPSRGCSKYYHCRSDNWWSKSSVFFLGLFFIFQVFFSKTRLYLRSKLHICDFVFEIPSIMFHGGGGLIKSMHHFIS
jgi:hypothetical protein